MSCGDDWKTLLSRLVDDELDAEERAKAEDHLAGCAPCRELLDLFRKNESLISNALSSEAFGNDLIATVAAEIRREGPPPVAKPVDEGPWEWVRSRPAVSVAAGALVVVSLTFVLNASLSRELDRHKGRLDDARRQVSALAASHQDQAAAERVRQAEYEKLILSLRTEDALRRAPDRYALAFIDPDHKLVVRASFNPATFKSFDVFRREEGSSGAFRKVNVRRLDKPVFEDATVEAGRGYVYRFRAYEGDREDVFSESFPLQMRIPTIPRLEPEKSISVHCTKIAVNGTLGEFTLERRVNGRPVAHKFHVKPGSPLGAVEDVPGVGLVDFRTNLVLERMEEGNQVMTVSLTRPLLDAMGKPVLKRVEGDTFVPETVQFDEVLSIRANPRAVLRPGASAADRTPIELWKNSTLQVRALE